MSHNGIHAPIRPAAIKARDVYLMAVKLLAKHGAAACDVASFTEKEHAIRGDSVHRDAWTAVRSTLDDMLANRLAVDGMSIH